MYISWPFSSGLLSLYQCFLSVFMCVYECWAWVSVSILSDKAMNWIYHSVDQCAIFMMNSFEIYVIVRQFVQKYGVDCVHCLVKIEYKLSKFTVVPWQNSIADAISSKHQCYRFNCRFKYQFQLVSCVLYSILSGIFSQFGSFARSFIRSICPLSLWLQPFPNKFPSNSIPIGLIEWVAKIIDKTG